MVHKVKAIGFSLDISLKCIWRDAKLFTIPHDKGNGGATIVVGPNWNKNILVWGTSPCNRHI